MLCEFWDKSEGPISKNLEIKENSTKTEDKLKAGTAKKKKKALEGKEIREVGHVKGSVNKYQPY